MLSEKKFYSIRLMIKICLILANIPENESMNPVFRSYPSVLYVWSGQDASVMNANDFVAVIDFDELSSTYGSILRVVPLVSDPTNGIGQSKNEPHHAGISSNGRYYITGGLLSFLSSQKEIFIWKIPRNPEDGPKFVCGIDAPGACTDEFQPTGDSKFLVSMMCDENAKSPGDMVEINADNCTAKSILTDRSSMENFNPHGYGRLSNGSIFVADYIEPITLTSTDPSKIVFRNTLRHFSPDGSLEQVFTVPFPTPPGQPRTTGLGNGIGFMELKAIPNDPYGRVFAFGTNTNTVYLLGPSIMEPIPVLDLSAVNGYIKSPGAEMVSIFPDGRHMLVTTQMRYVILVDIVKPLTPKILRSFDFCSDTAIYDMPIRVPGTNNTTTFPRYCAENNNIVGTHVIMHPQVENRFVVLNYFLKFGLAQFAGTRTMHAFKLNKALTDFEYDHRFNPNFETARGKHSQTFNSLQAYPHHALYLKL